MTVKMRLGWDDESLTAPALARAFEQVGVAAVIIHGRTREQGFKGRVNRAGIRAVVEAVERMPVVGNGDVRTMADAAATFRETGCAAISIGRGALSNPFIFRQLDHWADARHARPRARRSTSGIDLMAAHFHGLVARRGERLACLQFRKIIKWYNHAIRPPKDLYHRLINLASVRLFDETVADDSRHGPDLAACRATSSRGCRCRRGRLISGEARCVSLPERRSPGYNRAWVRHDQRP